MASVRAHLAVLICLAIIIASPIWPLMAVAHATDISHPRAYVFGTVTKMVKPGVSVWWWQDADGLDHYLPFKLQTGNYVVPVWKMKLAEDQFPAENVTVFSGSTNDEYIKLAYEHGYVWYIKNVLDDQHNTIEHSYLEFSVNIPVEASTRLLFCAMKNTVSGSGHIGVQVETSSAGETYKILIWLCAPDHVTYDSSIKKAIFYYDTPDDAENKYVVLLTDTLENMLERASGKSIDIDYITRVMLYLRVINSTDLTDEMVEGYFKFAIITDITGLKINDVFINATDVVFVPTSSGDVLNVYGLKVDSIYDVQIPFIYETEPEMVGYADKLKIAYTWQFQVPDDPNAGSFTNMGLNFTLNKDSGYYDYLYLNGEDKLSAIADHKAGDTITLATGLTAGTLYTLQARVSYTADEYDALTSAPIFWYNPGGWLAYHFWELIAVIASVLGLTTVATKARSRARAYRRPRWK